MFCNWVSCSCLWVFSCANVVNERGKEEAHLLAVWSHQLQYLFFSILMTVALALEGNWVAFFSLLLQN